MRNRVVLISKDVLMKSYLPVYGNTYYRTPNIDALARSGTVFLRHYTAAPSTAMAFTSMFTGLYGYQTNRRKYVEVSDFEGDTLFDIMNRNGYSCHVVWDVSYRTLAQKYSKCYGSNTKIHNTTFLTRKQPAHVWGQYDDMSFHAGLEDECVLKTEERRNRSVRVRKGVHVDTSAARFVGTQCLRFGYRPAGPHGWGV